MSGYKLRCKAGFTLIELMIVVAIIGILAAIAIPNFLGMQEKSKRRALQEIASSAKGELHNWLASAEKKESGVVDVNGDGIVEPTEVHTSLLTVANSWVEAMTNKRGKTYYSPWDGTRELFVIGPPDAANRGQITLSVLNDGKGIKIIALDSDGGVIITDSVSIE